MEALARPRLSESDWISAAIDVIAEAGIGAVTVESLARRLNVTKGSFYWHFPSREALLSAALQHWRDADTGDLIARVTHIADPRERLRTLFRLTSKTFRMHKVHSALLRAVDLPLVRTMMEAASAKRLQVLTQLFEECGLDAVQAGFRAQLAYSAYVGFLQLVVQAHLPRMSAERFDAYVEHVIETLVP